MCEYINLNVDIEVCLREINQFPVSRPKTNLLTIMYVTVCAGVGGWWWWFLMNTSTAMPVTFRQSLPSASVQVRWVVVGYILLLHIYKSTYVEMTFPLFSPPQEPKGNDLSRWCTSQWRSRSPASCASSPCATTPGPALRPGSGDAWPKFSLCRNHAAGCQLRLNVASNAVKKVDVGHL